MFVNILFKVCIFLRKNSLGYLRLMLTMSSSIGDSIYIFIEFLLLYLLVRASLIMEASPPGMFMRW